MEIDFVFAAVVVALLVWWIWEIRRGKKQGSTEESANPESGKFESEKSLSSDQFLSQITKVRVEAERTVNQLSRQYAQSIEAQVKEDEALKGRLSKFAKENRLDHALIKLWDEVKNYPSWSKRPDFKQYDKLNFDSFGESTESDNRLIWFSDGRSKFSIKTRTWSGMDSENYQDFTLLENDDEVFSISTLIDYETHVTSFSPISVNMFKRRGTWALILIEASAKLELASEKSSADWRARLAKDIKDKFSE